MKKNFMTRVLAVALSAAMALSMATATNLTVAEAAAKPAMKSASFAVRIGNKAKNYYATAATQKAYKIVKAKAGNTDKATAKVVKSGKAVAITAGTKTGKTNITLTFKNRKTAAKKTLKFSGKVLAAKVAEQSIKEIKQTALDTIEVTLAVAPKTVAASEFSVKRETVNTSNQNIVVKSAKADEKDAAKITLVVYGKLNDAATYDVDYTVEEKTVSGKFVATDGIVAKIEVTPTTVTAGKDTTLYYVTFDKDGIQLDKQKVGANVDSKVEISEKVTNGNGYISENKVYLASVGDTMDVTATYHTYKYDGATEIGAVTSTTTITAVENATKIAAVPYTISPVAVWNWKNVTPVTTIAVGDTGKYLRMLVTKEDGSVLLPTDEYTVESSDAGVFVVDGNAASDNLITPVSVGSAYALIKDKKGAVVYSLPINVVAARHIERVILTKTSMIVSTNGAFKYALDQTMPLVYDQYNEIYTGATTNVECVGAPSEEKAEKSAICSAFIAKDALSGAYYVKSGDLSAYKKGVYTFKVTGTDDITGAKKYMSFTVETRNTMGQTDSYEILLTENNVDAYAKTEFDTATTVNKAPGTSQAKKIYAHVVVKNNAVVKNNTVIDATVGAVTVKKNGVVIAATGVGITTKKTCAAIQQADFGNNVGAATGTNAEVVTINAVNGDGTDGTPYEKFIEPGNYSIEAVVYKDNKKTTVTKNFTVKDTEASATIQVLKTAVDGQSISKTNEKVFTYTYDGVELVNPADGTVDTSVVKGLSFAPTNAYEYDTNDLYVKAKNTFVVKKAFVKYALPQATATGFEKTVHVVIPVTVNRNFTYYGSDANKDAWGIS